jgi:hypothetical protein
VAGQGVGKKHCKNRLARKQPTAMVTGAMSNPTNTPMTVNRNTSLPFTLVRNLWTCDDAGFDDILLKGVHITIEAADWSEDTYAEEGFSGDWVVHLSDDKRFDGLTEEQKDVAMDAVCTFVEHLAADISRGREVPVVEDSSWSVNGI